MKLYHIQSMIKIWELISYIIHEILFDEIIDIPIIMRKILLISYINIFILYIFEQH